MEINYGSLYLYKNKDSLLFSPKIIPHLKSKYDYTKQNNSHIPCFKEEYTGYEIFTDISTTLF